jgi:hypothetical protein
MELTCPGIGDGGSGRASVEGSGGILLILKENMIDPSANNEVSGKLENALIVSWIAHEMFAQKRHTRSLSRLAPISAPLSDAPLLVPSPGRNYRPPSP